MAGIELKNIQKTYGVEGRKVQVLNGINLQIPAGQITVILGRSGCGKTTLLRIIGELEVADEGKVKLDEAKKMAFVFQEARLMPWLNVRENVEFGLKKQERDNAFVQGIIGMVGLEGFENAYPHQLSGGMQQRTAIARALAYEPSFIMMDEPFAALDYFTRAQMQQELIRMQNERGTSICFVTHSIDEALLLGHKIVILENGKVKAVFRIEKNNEERNLLDADFIQLKREIIGQLELG